MPAAWILLLEFIIFFTFLFYNILQTILFLFKFKMTLNLLLLLQMKKVTLSEKLKQFFLTRLLVIVLLFWLNGLDILNSLGNLFLLFLILKLSIVTNLFIALFLLKRGVL